MNLVLELGKKNFLVLKLMWVENVGVVDKAELGAYSRGRDLESM